MKILVRRKNIFVEKFTKEKINPSRLSHFGTDLIDYDDRKEYAKKMEKDGVDYLFFSKQFEEC